MVVHHLTENAAMNPALLQESPYTDFNPRGLKPPVGRIWPGSRERRVALQRLRSAQRSEDDRQRSIPESTA